MDELQRLKIRVEALERELQEAQRREDEAKRQVKHLEGQLEVVVYVLATWVSRGY